MTSPVFGAASPSAGKDFEFRISILAFRKSTLAFRISIVIMQHTPAGFAGSGDTQEAW